MAPANAVDRLIVACSQLHAVGKEKPEAFLVGGMASVPPKSSTMRNARAYLKRNGLADTSNSKTLTLTQKGHDRARQLVGKVDLPAATNSDFHAKNKATIRKKGGSKKSIEIYVGVSLFAWCYIDRTLSLILVPVQEFLEDGEARTDDEIAEAIKVDKKVSAAFRFLSVDNKGRLCVSHLLVAISQKSTYRNAKAPLNKLDLLEAVDGNRFRLAGKCFAFGRDDKMGVTKL